MLLLSSGLAIGATPAISDNDARQIGIEAYVDLYPLISMDATRRVSTNVEAGKNPGLGLAGASSTSVNSPTLYSLAWFDVSKDPYLNTLCTVRRPKQFAARKHPNELPYP